MDKWMDGRMDVLHTENGFVFEILEKVVDIWMFTEPVLPLDFKGIMRIIYWGKCLFLVLLEIQNKGSQYLIEGEWFYKNIAWLRHSQSL